MSRALVFGATGHIGSHVVRALLGRGDAVRAAYRSPRYAFLLDGLPVERVALASGPKVERVARDPPRVLRGRCHVLWCGGEVVPGCWIQPMQSTGESRQADRRQCLLAFGPWLDAAGTRYEVVHVEIPEMSVDTAL